MKSNIFIPKTIKIGFQKRNDTYTKKLAYIIYYDQKDVLRKEASWQSWRDKKIPDLNFSNTPTTGFVLNKKAGGYSSGWNHRQTYVRVYDPRDFEFEISIPNLLFILENTNSIKGKGLEGEFVYGWDGTELVLIPTSAPDYVEIMQYNEIIYANNTIKAKDLILGATYKTKDNKEWIYMGKYDYHTTEYEYGEYDYISRTYVYKNVNKGKYYYFIPKAGNFNYYNNLKLKSLGNRFISIVSTDCVENYAELFDKLEATPDYSPIDESKDEYVLYTFDEFVNKINSNNYYHRIDCYNKHKNVYEICKNNNENLFSYRNNKDYNNKSIPKTLEEIYNELQPMYKNQYLTNGKLYKEGR